MQTKATAWSVWYCEQVTSILNIRLKYWGSRLSTTHIPCRCSACKRAVRPSPPYFPPSAWYVAFSLGDSRQASDFLRGTSKPVRRAGRPPWFSNWNWSRTDHRTVAKTSFILRAVRKLVTWNFTTERGNPRFQNWPLIIVRPLTWNIRARLPQRISHHLNKVLWVSVLWLVNNNAGLFLSTLAHIVTSNLMQNSCLLTNNMYSCIPLCNWTMCLLTLTQEDETPGLLY